LNSLNSNTPHHDDQIPENVLGAASVGQGALSPEGVPPVLPEQVGSPLTAADYAALEARWIDRRLADHARLRRVDSLTGGEIMGRKGSNCAGIAIPYFLPGSDRLREYRLRRDHPDLEYGT
jgi:hypothetical protein